MANINIGTVDLMAGTPGTKYHPEEHPNRNQLTAFAADALSPLERDAMCAHIGNCVECREFLALITPEEGPPAAVARSRRRAA